MSRRGPPPHAAGGAHASVPDLLTTEVEEELARWTEDGRALYESLLAQANSELQCELLQRAVAAKHRAEEIRAFAEAIRRLPDAALYEACCPRAQGPGAPTVVQRLRAEADPLFGYELNHGPLLSPPGAKPGAARLTSYAPPGSPARARPQFPAAEPTRAPTGFEVDLIGSRSRRAARELFDEGPAAAELESSRGQALAEDLLNLAGKPLGVTYRERVVDDRDLTLVGAVEALKQALEQGWPVPVFLGPRAKESLQGALFLQVRAVAGGHAFQLHAPFDRQTVWVNERDLTQGRELPLDDPELRRLTRVCLPQGPAPTRAAAGRPRGAPLTRKGGS